MTDGARRKGPALLAAAGQQVGVPGLEIRRPQPLERDGADEGVDLPIEQLLPALLGLGRGLLIGEPRLDALAHRLLRRVDGGAGVDGAQQLREALLGVLALTADGHIVGSTLALGVGPNVELDLPRRLAALADRAPTHGCSPSRLACRPASVSRWTG